MLSILEESAPNVFIDAQMQAEDAPRQMLEWKAKARDLYREGLCLGPVVYT